MSVLVDSNSAMIDTSLPSSIRVVSPSTTNFKFPCIRREKPRHIISTEILKNDVRERFASGREFPGTLSVAPIFLNTLISQHIKIECFIHFVLLQTLLIFQIIYLSNFQCMVLMDGNFIFLCCQIYESFASGFLFLWCHA